MKSLLMSAVALCISFTLHAADKPQTPAGDKTPTKEQRESMAKAHDQMAVCLRSDKSIDACHDEMRQACKANDACPMMKGHMGMHKGN